MKKILLPTDFSDNSWNAIKYVLKLYKKEECIFFLLNAYTPIIYQMEYFSIGNAQAGIINTAVETSEKGLDEMLQKIKIEFKNSKHSFSKISSFNTLISEIKRLLLGHVFDSIVMGTKGATGAQEILFGSNAVHVIKSAKCPVLTIPSDFSFEEPLEILFPSDYEVDFQEKQLQPIIDIALSYHSQINILNVSYGKDLTEKQERNKQKLELYFKKIAHIFHSVRNQDVPEAISKFQVKARINLLVMINNKHSFFENLFFKSTINQIGFHLKIPFLVLSSNA